MFKVGDTVYCINRFYNPKKNTSSILNYIEEDTPYTISNVGNYDVTIKELNHNSYRIERFISEEDYIILK